MNKLLVSLVCITLLCSCGGSSEKEAKDDSLTSMEVLKNTWDDNALLSYEFIIRKTFFGCNKNTQSGVIWVENGVVKAAINGENNGLEPDSSDWYTMDDVLLELVNASQNNGDIFTLNNMSESPPELSTQLGFPIEIYYETANSECEYILLEVSSFLSTDSLSFSASDTPAQLVGEFVQGDNEVILTFSDAVNVIGETIRLQEKYDLTINSFYFNSFKGFSSNLNIQQIEDIKFESSIATIESQGDISPDD